MERYWIPSIFDSALFGSKLADEFFQVHQGGDIAFLNGVLKHLIALGTVDKEFIEKQTVGFDELRVSIENQPWEDLERFKRC